MKNNIDLARLVRTTLLVLLVLPGWLALPDVVSQLVYATAPTPAPGSGSPGTAQLTGKTIHKQAPAEVVQQIDLRLGGGEYPGCIYQPETPTLHYMTDNLEVTDVAILSTCGWKPDETITVTLSAPQGKILTSEVKAVSARNNPGVYQADILFQPGADAPEGKYRFTLQGSGTVKAKVTFNRPKGARLYALSDNPFQPKLGTVGGQQRLRLTGFLPNEPLRLLAYQFEGTLIQFYGWQDYQADPSGNLVIETDLSEITEDRQMNYYAYGRETHSVALERFTSDGQRLSRRFDMDLYCPGAQTPNISSAMQIRPAAGLTSMDIHQQPGFGSRVTTQVSADTPVRVFGYPKCIDHAFWYQVSVNKPFLFGWVAENFLGKTLIESVK